MSAKDFSDTKPLGLYEVAIGDKNQDYYLSKFDDFDDKGPGLHASWNWAAFFFTGFWALYRKMYGWFFALCAIGTVGSVMMKMPNPQIQQWLGFGYIACFIGFGAYANALYHRKVKALIVSAQKSSSDASRLSGRLSAGGGVNRWVPLVCGAVPVIGVVAAIALPAYQDYTKRQSLVASVGQVPVTEEKPIAYEANEYPAQQVKNVNPFSAPNSRKTDSSGQTLTPSSLSYEANEYNKALAAFERRDYSTVLNVLRPIAAQGHTGSQSLLGTMYFNGLGVVQNYTEAERWYRMAAARGDGSAMTNLGTMYFDGKGVAQNYREASRLYRLAAEQGEWYAQGLLGEAYANGQGETYDIVRAHMWINLSAASGSDKQAEFRNNLERAMTQQQIAQAQLMARDCQQRNFKNCN